MVDGSAGPRGTSNESAAVRSRMPRTPARAPLVPVFVVALVLGAALFFTAGEASAGDVLPSVPASRPVAVGSAAAARPQTGLQLAATQGLTYEDARTYVMLEQGHLRVRLYPGTYKAVVAGHEYTVKDRIVRHGRNVVLSGRVVSFLNRQIGSFRAEEASRRRLQAMRARPKRLPPLRPRKVVQPAQRKATPPKAVAATPKPRPLDGGIWVPPVAERDWKWIVLHHSDDESGSVAKYDRYHRYTKGWEHGCGYHFVIGNGTETRDGEVEMGPRWLKQLHGAHAKTPDNRFNDFGVGICMVGDFHNGSGRPSEAQMDALVQLVRWAMDRYDIPLEHVHGHCDCCKTCCPGRNFPWAEFRRRLR